MSDENTTLDTKVLDAIIKAWKTDNITGKIGVLGATDSRSGAADENSNASIGLKHEFGDPSENLPVRSFLRMPLTEKLQDGIESSGEFSKDGLQEVIQEKSLLPWIKKLMLLGETIVLDAFATGGFGKWKPANMKFKKNHQTLVETQQLRNSITSEVDT